MVIVVVLVIGLILAVQGAFLAAVTRSESDGSPFWGGSRQTHLQRRNF